jgi:hypothetical protein
VIARCTTCGLDEVELRAGPHACMHRNQECISLGRPIFLDHGDEARQNDGRPDILAVVLPISERCRCRVAPADCTALTAGNDG